MDQPKPNYCPHCEVAIIADSDRPYVEIGPLYQTLEPRWATKAGASTYSGLSRSMLYLAAAEGHIKTYSVKRGEGVKRGRRLVDLRSLDQWITKWVSEL